MLYGGQLPKIATMKRGIQLFGQSASHMTAQKRELCKAISRWVDYAIEQPGASDSTIWAQWASDWDFLASWLAENQTGSASIGFRIAARFGVFSLEIRGHRLTVKKMRKKTR